MLDIPANFFPDRVPIDAYGNGGFRFGGMGHKGSLLALAEGMYAWTVTADDAITLALLAPILARLASPQFLLLGTGRRQIFPPADVVAAFRNANIALDAMDTGAAARTWNILLAEKRPVCAALIAVD